jgi:hypothetical protein
VGLTPTLCRNRIAGLPKSNLNAITLSRAGAGRFFCHQNQPSSTQERLTFLRRRFFFCVRVSRRIHVNRREFLRPFADPSLLPTRSPWSIPGWLGYVNAVLAGGLISACGDSPTTPTATTPPSTTTSPSQLQPLAKVVASNGTLAELRYYGYANRDQLLLLDAMRVANLDPQVRKFGYGAGTWELSSSVYGWIFCVQNDWQGSDVSSIKLNNNQLWSAYEKQSVG